ncbi:MAG: hypothetical protein JKY37_04735 [Nannocystaceae bacterium]|nr:hypothetical protein [Nannocystaceae bacterium]
MRVQHVQPAERDALRARGHGWAQYLAADLVAADQVAADRQAAHGSADDVESEWVGRRGDRRTVIVAQRVATEADLRGARKQRSEVAAWAWRLAVPVHERQHGPTAVAETGRPPSFGGPSVAFRIERDVLGRRPQPRQGLSPLACPRLRLSRVRAGTLGIELLGLDEGWADERELVASGLPKRGLALVDGWAVDPSGAENPEFSFAAFRRQHRRALTSQVELPWPTGPLRVRVWDVLHRTADLIVMVSPDTTRVRVASAQLQVGPAASVGIG